MTVKKTALVTGASKGGIGDHLVQELHRRGFRVFATARTAAKVEHLKEMGVEIVLLEVTDSDSIKKAAAEVSSLTDGKLDMLINNSGVGLISSILDTDIAAAKALFDVNIWGLWEVTQAFSPMLIASKGTIVNIGSVAGRLPIPFEGAYNMSKAALEHLSKQMHVEFYPFDIKVVHVNTGGIKTPFFSNSDRATVPENSLYQPCSPELEPWLKGEVEDIMQKTLPADFAKNVIDNAVKSSPASIQYTGYGGWQTWVFTKLLWHNATDIMLRVMGVPDMKKALKRNN